MILEFREYPPVRRPDCGHCGRECSGVLTVHYKTACLECFTRIALNKRPCEVTVTKDQRRGGMMQNPDTGAFEPIPGDDPANAKPDWKVYTVGQRVTFGGWWWEITGIEFDEDGQGQLTVRPVENANRRQGDEQKSLLEALEKLKEAY